MILVLFIVVFLFHRIKPTFLPSFLLYPSFIILFHPSVPLGLACFARWLAPPCRPAALARTSTHTWTLPQTVTIGLLLLFWSRGPSQVSSLLTFECSHSFCHFVPCSATFSRTRDLPSFHPACIHTAAVAVDEARIGSRGTDFMFCQWPSCIWLFVNSFLPWLVEKCMMSNVSSYI